MDRVDALDKISLYSMNDNKKNAKVDENHVYTIEQILDVLDKKNEVL